MNRMKNKGLDIGRLSQYIARLAYWRVDKKLKRRFSPLNSFKRGLSYLGSGSLAVMFTVLGIIIASNFDLAPKSFADQAEPLISGSRYPVVVNNGEYESPFVSVVERVSDAVVNISAQSINSKIPWWHRGTSYSTSSGSGFFFRSDGYILTNNHVVQKAEKLMVTTSSGYQYEASIVGADPQTDMAVLKVDLGDEKITTIPFGDSDKLKVGDWAIAIGNPFPQQGLDRTVTVGVISAKGRSNLNFGQETPIYQNYIQTDASINPGNSGGPLLNLRGECVGINSAISSPTGSSVGIGFAIPINMARATIPDLIETGKVKRSWLGVWLNDVTEREAKRQGLDAVKGVKIDSVFQNSPAESAGIKSGDIITKFDGRDVDNSGQLRVLVATLTKHSDIPLEVVREGKRINLITSVTDRRSINQLAQQEVVEPKDFEIAEWMGMEIMEYTPEIAEIIGAEYVSGMYVRRVYRGSPAAFASIARGTIILQVNDSPIKTLEDFEVIVGKIRNPKKRIPLIVQEPNGDITQKVIKQN